MWRRDGCIVADRSNMCESVRRQYGAKQAHTEVSLHKRAVYRARN